MNKITTARKQKVYATFPGCMLCKVKLPIEELMLISEPEKGDYLYCRDCCRMKFGAGRYQRPGRDDL